MTPVEQLAASVAASGTAAFVGGFVGAWVRLAKLEKQVEMDEGRINRLEAVLDRMMLQGHERGA